jgi:hypothetical protein
VNVVRLLEIASAAGLSLIVDGDNLVVEADRDAPPELIIELGQHKAELIAILLPDAGNAAPPALGGAADVPAEAAIIEDVGADLQGHHEPNLIAPLSWHERLLSPVLTEAPYDQPCQSRCGQTKRDGAVFFHFCIACGAWGPYGYGATGSRLGFWYCGKHRPSEKS